MATKNTQPAARERKTPAAQAKPRAPVPTPPPAPAPGADPRVTGTLGGVTVEKAAEMNAESEAAGRIVAPAPTPTVESTDPANVEAAHGGTRERKKLKTEPDLVSVTVPRGFRLTDADGEHQYDAGIQDMRRDHAEHWYAKAHGIELNE